MGPGLDGKERERGRVGGGLCTKADWGSADAPNAGDRSISLKMEKRLDDELARPTLRGEERGWAWWTNWSESGGMMVRFKGRCRFESGWSYWQVSKWLHVKRAQMGCRPPAHAFGHCRGAPVGCNHVEVLCQHIDIDMHRTGARVPLAREYCSSRLHWHRHQSCQWATAHRCGSRALRPTGVWTR
jgi:hypothetical protein